MTAVKTSILFNFGYVKKLAKPGSWRRGYAYFQTGQVLALEQTETGVHGKVKGNFKDAYAVDLAFTPEAVKATCDCPLQEEWCKHAVSVALVSIDRHRWEQFWDLPVEDEVEPLLDLQGNYSFHVWPHKKPGSMALRIIDRARDAAVLKFEPILNAAIEMEKKLNPVERREIGVFQHLIHQGYKHVPEKDGWLLLPNKHASGLISALQNGAEEVCDKAGKRLVFAETPLKLVMSVNASLAGNVLVSLHWHRQQPEDIFPLDAVTLFDKKVPWGIYRQHLFPLTGRLDVLPGHLTKHSFTDIRDADGGKFMYEELPKLRKLVTVEEGEMLDEAKLKQTAPKKVLKLEMVDAATMRLRVTLSFSYDGIEVAYSKGTPDTPYVMVTKKKKSAENLYWVKRDLKAEQEAYEKLSASSLEPLQTNNFMAEGDDAIDFYNTLLPHLDETWTVKKNDKELKSLQASQHPLLIRAHIDFAESVDAFVLSVSCAIGKRELDLDEVQHQLMQGKKYFYLDGAGFVEIPLASILQFGRSLQAFDAEELKRDVHKIQTFKAGLIAELVDQGVELQLSPKFQKFWDVISGQSDMEEVEVPKKVKAKLRSYQKKGFNWLWFLYSYGLNGVLADDMGLGKTLQALTVLQQAKDVDGQAPSLVVCPTTIVFNWENEIRRFTPDLKVVTISGPDRHGQYKKIKDADIVLTSYAILRRDIAAFKNYQFRHVILDESQNIKNHTSQTAMASKQLMCHHRLALSGTPFENRLSELWSLFDYLMPTFLYDIDTFRHKFVMQIEEKGNREAERRLKKQVFPFILRRMKQDVAKDLPPKIETVAYCELTDAQREVYLDLLDKMRDEVFAQVGEKGIAGSQNSIFTLLLRLRQLCCHPKLLEADLSQGLNESGKFNALKSMLEEIVSEGHRVLIFSQFVEMLKLMKGHLEKTGIKYEYLTGETSVENRAISVNRFNTDDSIPVFLISLKAGGTGLNLTGADYVIHYDPWWNPAAEDQATDRAHRIGQEKSVFVYRLITKGTVEEKIMKLKDRKRSLVDSIIAADRSMGKFLSMEDLKEILSPDL